jgi:hypothetical protein
VFLDANAIVSTSVKRLDTIHMNQKWGSSSLLGNSVVPQAVQKTRPDFTRPSAIIRKGGGVRGRVIATGLVVAALFFNSAGATTARSNPFGIKGAHGSIAAVTSNRRSTSEPYVPMSARVPLDDILQIREENFEEDNVTTSAIPSLEFSYGTTA